MTVPAMTGNDPQPQKRFNMTQQHRNTRASAPKFIALAAALLLHPLVQAQTDKAPHGHGHSHGADGASMPAGKMDMKAMMKENNGMMSSMKMTGNPDVDFAMMMRVHHQGAIQMAEAQLRDGKEPQMRTMATEIIAAQKKEIAQLDQFLAKHGHGVDKMSK